VVLRPADNASCDPTTLVEEPTSTEMAPAAPDKDAPVDKVTRPVFPLVAVPVRISSAPVFPVPVESAVHTLTAPETGPWPDTMLTAPPVPDPDPPAMDTAPPTELAPTALPAEKVTAPPTLLAAWASDPLTTNGAPSAPCESPATSDMEPPRPVPVPEVTTTCPPEKDPPSAFPADNEIIPPSPVLLRPTMTETPPATPPVAEPTESKNDPELPLGADPVLNVMAPEWVKESAVTKNAAPDETGPPAVGSVTAPVVIDTEPPVDTPVPALTVTL
jgi:hypothetical protein